MAHSHAVPCPEYPNPRTPHRRGFTLLELTAALLLLGVALSHLLPAARRQVDRMAVLGAREDVAGLFHRARLTAVARGGAVLRLSTEPPVLELEAGSEVVERLSLSEPYGVLLGLSRERKEAELVLDALGLGRVASQTLTFSRGEARTTLVISSRGRISRP